MITFVTFEQKMTYFFAAHSFEENMADTAKTIWDVSILQLSQTINS